MVMVRNVFLNYEDGGETSFLFMGRGRNVFPEYELGAKRLTKKWCELTMGRKVCVPFFCQDNVQTNLTDNPECMAWLSIGFCNLYFSVCPVTQSFQSKREMSTKHFTLRVVHVRCALATAIFFDPPISIANPGSEEMGGGAPGVLGLTPKIFW